MEKTIEIKKVKMNNDSSLTVNFDEVITGETPIVNKFTRDGGGKAHADMKIALNALNVHLMLLCEQAKTKTSNTLDSIAVTGFVIGGAYEGWFPYRFTYRAQKLPTVELRKNRKGHYFTVKGANGKVLNHSFNSKRGCLNGIEALRRAMADFEIVDLTEPKK